MVLPGSDGIQLMNDILRTEDVPVIFLSAYIQEETVVRTFDTGAADYVVKSFSPTELAVQSPRVLTRAVLFSRCGMRK